MAEQDTMTTIYEGLSIKPSPGDSASDLVSAIQSLYDEYKTAYKDEWDRLTANEKIYLGDHWSDTGSDSNEPQPVMPIIFSTVENIQADLMDEYPEAVVTPESSNDEKIGKILTRVVAQNHEACDYLYEYNDLIHDLLVGGYMVQEVGWDPTLNYGFGGAYIRCVSNKNIMFDPLCANIQDGRAVFKIERLPTSWFKQHYPDYADYFSGGSDLVPDDHFSFGTEIESKETKYMILLEAWIRTYDAENHKYSVHMLQIAGGQLLENSYIEKPEGYFMHGMYPFVCTPLYKIKGSPFGRGIVDMFKNPQQYSDKINQILLKNALTAGTNRILVQKGSADLDEIRDFSKQIIEVSNIGGITWFQDRPLPAFLMNYMINMQNGIKEEAGSNDFSRGNTTGGVTAASAITALMDASSKRSRKEAQVIHNGFAQAVRMELEVEREFETETRTVEITVMGEKQSLSVHEGFFKDVQNGYDKLPVEFRVSIKPARESRFTKLSNNELILQIMTMYQGRTINPAILMEAMDFEGKDIVLEKLKASQQQSIEALQGQLAEAQGQNQMLAEENASMSSAVNEMQMSVGGGQQAQAPLNMQNVHAGVF